MSPLKPKSSSFALKECGSGRCGLSSSTKVEPEEIRTCPCDPRIKIPDTEISQRFTLLKYTNPYKVVMNMRKSDIKPKPVEVDAKPDSELLADHSPETQEVLDCIQEPRMWMKNGELWTQVVSPATTKRYEIILLYDDLNRRLWERHARPNGMCRVRYEISRQLFDELTRQVTVTCAERGLFLVRIRAEINYTIQVYHYMWRDIMEYFEPIVQKSVDIMASVRRQVDELEAEIKGIKEEMEDVHWKTILMEQERAYARQATLEWYSCRIEEEKLQMLRLATLFEVMSTGNFNINNTSDILSLDEERDKEPGKTRKKSDLDFSQALHQSDTLKELINERKVAEGRTKTKRLLEDEIIWARGEISRNKAYLTDLLRFKEPLDYDKWLESLVEGRDDPTEITLALGYERGVHSTAHVEQDSSIKVRDRTSDSGKRSTLPKIPFIKWIMTRKPDQCKCRGQDCRLENCGTIDWDLLIQQARSEFLHGYDDRPLVRFDEFIEKWLTTKDVRQIYALSQFFENKQLPDYVDSSLQSIQSAGPLAAAGDKFTFLRPNKFMKRITEFRPSKENPYRLQSSSVRPNFRKPGRMVWKDSMIYADSFAPRKREPCTRLISTNHHQMNRRVNRASPCDETILDTFNKDGSRLPRPTNLWKRSQTHPSPDFIHF